MEHGVIVIHTHCAECQDQVVTALEENIDARYTEVREVVRVGMAVVAWVTVKSGTPFDIVVWDIYLGIKTHEPLVITAVGQTVNSILQWDDEAILPHLNYRRPR